jgi:hypothetical protein
MAVTFAWFERQLKRLDDAYFPALHMAGHLPFYVQPLVCPLRTVVNEREALYAQYLRAFMATAATDHQSAALLTAPAYPPRLAAYVARMAPNGPPDAG